MRFSLGRQDKNEDASVEDSGEETSEAQAVTCSGGVTIKKIGAGYGE